MKFTDSHEWIELDQDIALVGITNYAQKELGSIVYVELPMIGKQIDAKLEIAVLESTKAAVDIYSPLSGIIVEVNEKLNTTPELINQSPEKLGWIYKIRILNSAEIDLLMDQSSYQSMLNGIS